MDELAESLSRALASTFAMYLKTQFFHWNVEGREFYNDHKFLQDIYEELYGAVDPIAEQIRALGSYAPGSLSRFQQLSVIRDQVQVIQGVEMYSTLLADNAMVLSVLDTARANAERFNKTGLANFLQDRIDQHSKHAWMLRATVKQNEQV